MSIKSPNNTRGRPKSPRDLIRISAHIPMDHYDLLRSISEEEDLSVAQIFRRAVELYLISQKDVLGIDDGDISYAKHISETRSKKAIFINHSEKFLEMANKDSGKSNIDALEIFEELNPAAF